MKVYEESVPCTKKIPHFAVKFEAGEDNRIWKFELFTPFFPSTVREKVPHFTIKFDSDRLRKILMKACFFKTFLFFSLYAKHSFDEWKCFDQIMITYYVWKKKLICFRIFQVNRKWPIGYSTRNTVSGWFSATVRTEAIYFSTWKKRFLWTTFRGIPVTTCQSLSWLCPTQGWSQSRIRMPGRPSPWSTRGQAVVATAATLRHWFSHPLEISSDQQCLSTYLADSVWRPRAETRQYPSVRHWDSHLQYCVRRSTDDWETDEHLQNWRNDSGVRWRWRSRKMPVPGLRLGYQHEAMEGQKHAITEHLGWDDIRHVLPEDGRWYSVSGFELSRRWLHPGRWNGWWTNQVEIYQQWRVGENLLSLDCLHGWTRHGLRTRPFTKYAVCDSGRRWRCCLFHQFTALWCHIAELCTYIGESHLCRPSRQQDKGTRRQHFHEKHGHTLTTGTLNLTQDLFLI